MAQCYNCGIDYDSLKFQACPDCGSDWVEDSPEEEYDWEEEFKHVACEYLIGIDPHTNPYNSGVTIVRRHVSPTAPLSETLVATYQYRFQQ